MAGLVKAILMVERGWIPPQPCFSVPSRALAGTGFVVRAGQAEPWPAESRQGQTIPRRCGVNSFGIGGTSAHAVVCQPPSPAPARDEPGSPQLFVLSARDASGLRRVTQALHAELEACWQGGGQQARGTPSPADVAYTLQAGRAVLEYRRAFIARTRDGVLGGLRAISQGQPGRSGDAEDAGDVDPGTAAAWRAVARRWLAGQAVGWNDIGAGQQRHRVPLPGYPFDRSSYWAMPRRGAAARYLAER